MWLIKYSNSIFLPQINLWLDPHFPVEKAFVSHAHFDHMAMHSAVICSAGTSRLMQARLPAERQELILEFEKTHLFDTETEIRLYSAGHIIGSAQLWARREDETLLYTGDFKLRPGCSAELCQTPSADVVIMETTFGLPQYRFPPTAAVLSQITQFCRQTLEDNETPVLLGYSLGKSQELLKSLTGANLPVMLHPQTDKLTRLYEAMGISFPAYREFVLAEVKGHVVICPTQTNNSAWLHKIKRRRVAVITGWALDPNAIYRYQCDAAFPLSDHADFDDLLAFVERVGPRKIFTVHGFAREFAQTLRERGYEAWALGLSNQMELALPVTTVFPDAAPSLFTPANAAPEDFLNFAHTAEKIRATAGKLEKCAILRDYFSALSDAALALAVTYFTGHAFPASRNRRLNCGWALLQRAILAVAQVPEATWRETYQRFRDSGEAAEALLAGRTTPRAQSLMALAVWWERVAEQRGPVAKTELVAEQLAQLSALEAKYLIKIMTGDLRIGLKEGLVEEALAQAVGQPFEAVRGANMLSGDLSLVARAARAGTLSELGLRVFHPLQFMLASPEPDAPSIVARVGETVWVEEKYDGIRCQIHKLGPRVELFSRELKNITAQFPELAQPAAMLSFDFIADGELLAWRGGRALPFADLQKRLGRQGGDFFLGKEIPVSLWLYDLLWLNGHSLVDASLQERREKLEALSLVPSRIETAPRQIINGVEEIEAAFLRARQRGNEGLMVKDPASVYRPGRRGLAWLKLKKAYATLDVVVVGVEYGHGKRRDVLSDYTFAVRAADDRLLTIGKAYSGLTDEEIAALTDHFLSRTLEERGRYRVVQPDIVLEIAFDSIQASSRHNSGLALRFPRILRIRSDKKPDEIDTLDFCQKLARASVLP